MSLSMELVPCCRLESLCCTVTSQFGSMNMRLTSALNSSIVISILEGLRTCWILCVTHIPAAPSFMYDRMNNIWCKCLNSELGAQTVLHLSVSRGVIQRENEAQQSATSSLQPCAQ